jgi:hypothetical protein
MKFQRLPEVVEAVRWDGTVEGAQKVANFLGRRYDGVEVVQKFYSSDEHTPEPLLKLPPGLRLEHSLLYPDCWLVKDRGYKIMNEERFERTYGPIDDSEET